MTYWGYDEDLGRAADKASTKQAFRDVKDDMWKVRDSVSAERRRICELVSVLLQILDKKTLNRKIEWKGRDRKVKDILYYDIDP